MKITLVGTGRVGSAIAFALTINPLASELLLLNRSREKAEGDALDLTHAAALVDSNMKIHAGEIADSKDSDVIIFTASVPFRYPNQTRLEMGIDNMPILRKWMPALAEASPNAIVLMVSNPVDALAYETIRLTGFDPKRVIGTGTLVDSIRYRALLSTELKIHAQDIRAYILGEHGDTQFAASSIAMTGGERFYPSDTSRRMFEETKAMGYEVFRLKGHTSYGIAMATITILDSIAYDLRHTMPVSVLVDGYLGLEDVCLSLPAVIGREGVTRILHPTLSDDEEAAFRKSAEIVKQTLAEMEAGQ
ncbi:lactate/malate dehydrogenase family protein [Rhodopirellula europaea]|jgi:L-lactate dehydrogenase|uniref:L-lactate/malate dehydrogenase n=1 Tax=Rhodopirellula europaea SH398 TaxID=1263868 RepID=M5S291_9BACT|nr:lactate/malate dehydrogenase family protein [Rhodopirellula europaea]EMI25738.1 L-lactate/malate dehydrogenase [Rhodopirellula europaea SH398]